MNMNEKASIRERFLKKRARMSEALKRELSNSICKNILNFNPFKSAKTIAMYFPVRSEADVLSLTNEKGKYFAFPKVAEKDILFSHADYPDGFVIGSFGILVPASCDFIDPGKIDLFLVPGVVFDERGYRLGYGKGFYDRFISKHAPKNTVGVCYNDFLIKSLKVDPWDTRVNYMVTDKGVFHTHKEVT
jgi:5-formyltetrahydrofolate cyclo-ligase